MNQNTKDIVAAYSDAVEAWGRHNNTPNDETHDAYAHHIIEANKMLAAMIGSQGSELLAIHDAITRGYFSEAKARLAEFTE